jgi:hypothetical protein
VLSRKKPQLRKFRGLAVQYPTRVTEATAGNRLVRMFAICAELRAGRQDIINPGIVLATLFDIGCLPAYD